jgi:hypothetical protein
MRHVTELSHWAVTLGVDGRVAEVWADGYQELDGAYVFGVLAEVDEPNAEGSVHCGSHPD